MIWALDAKNVVDEVKKKEDPSRWSTYHSVFTIRNKFLKADWSLNWKGKEANFVADITAKLVLSTNCVLIFYLCWLIMF